MQKLLAIMMNTGYRPLGWRLKETELALRLVCQLQLLESGICVMLLANLLLLSIRQVSNLFW